ncbi:MAG TPA: FlgD immunoglobulin-like domain containing protein, partial [Spirochaetota bacterium]|nr:FlgD immunoglobulin-like domain containing protein [Spirochaetota bacterium]
NLTQYTLTNLDASQVYYITLSAVDTSGNVSPRSGEQSAAPLGIDPAQQPDPVVSGNIIRQPGQSIKVDFAYAEGVKVEVRIYSITGKLNRTYNKISKSTGSVIWDGLNEDGNKVANGLYFLVIRSGDKQKIIKVGIMK